MNNWNLSIVHNHLPTVYDRDIWCSLGFVCQSLWHVVVSSSSSVVLYFRTDCKGGSCRQSNQLIFFSKQLRTVLLLFNRSDISGSIYIAELFPFNSVSLCFLHLTLSFDYVNSFYFLRSSSMKQATEHFICWIIIFWFYSQQKQKYCYNKSTQNVRKKNVSFIHSFRFNLLKILSTFLL